MRVPAAVPALLLCALAPLELALSTRRYWYTDAAYDAHILTVRLLVGLSVLGAAALAAWPKARAAAAEHLSELDSAPPGRRAAWLALSGAGIFALFLFLKHCQYRGFQLPQDSTATGNLAANILSRGSFACTVYGSENFFAAHFLPFLALLSPLLLLSPSLLPLIAVQTLFAAAMPLAAFHLAREKTGSALAGVCALWLVFTSPYLLHIAGANVHAGLYLSFFLFLALVCAETRRPRLAALAFVLAAATSEQACVAFAGLGAYLVFRLGPRTRRAWLAGGGAALGAVVMFLLEMRLRSSFAEAAPFRGWEMYSHLGGGPWQTMKALAWPPGKLAAPAAMLLSTGLLPLLEPASLIPWAVNYLPGFLAQPGDFYREATGHYAGYFIGPLWWAGTLGLARAHALLERRRLAAWLPVFVLGVGAASLVQSPGILLKDWNWSLFGEGPALTALVPRDASIWANQFLSPWLACRPFVKVLKRDAHPDFTGRLFVPDFVLLERYWMTAADPAWRDQVLSFLSKEGYVKAAERWQLVLLKHPRAPLAPEGGRPPSLALPSAEPRRAKSYADFVMRNDDMPATLALYREMAEKGDPKAQYNLGLFLYAGQGVAKDEAEGLRWWERAAAQGWPDAFNNLGVAAGQRKDWAAAERWFSEGARSGSADAASNLARLREAR